MKKLSKILVAMIFVFGLTLSMTTSAQAVGFTIYNSYVAWLNAVDAKLLPNSKVNENFEDLLLEPGFSITEVGGAGSIHDGVYENIVDKDVPRYQIYNYAPGMFAFGAFLDLFNPGGAGTSLDMVIDDDNTFVMNVPNTAAGQWYGFVADTFFYGVRFEDGGGTGIQETYYNVDLNLATSVPEPATMLLLGFGLIGLAGIGRKKLFNR